MGITQGGERAVSTDALDAFETEFAGDFVTPEDKSYDEARSVWNGMINRYPAVIVRCTGVADVIAAVNFAGDENLLVAI